MFVVIIIIYINTILSRYYWTVDNANLPRFAWRSYLFRL